MVVVFDVVLVLIVFVILELNILLHKFILSLDVAVVFVVIFFFSLPFLLCFFLI